VKGDEMDRACSTDGEKGRMYSISGEVRKKKNVIKMDLGEIGWGHVD
jgi:hypothetical protein